MKNEEKAGSATEPKTGVTAQENQVVKKVNESPFGELTPEDVQEMVDFIKTIYDAPDLDELHEALDNSSHAIEVLVVDCDDLYLPYIKELAQANIWLRTIVRTMDSYKHLAAKVS